MNHLQTFLRATNIMNLKHDKTKMYAVIAACGAYAAVLHETTNKKKRKRRSTWSRQWLLERQEKGAYNGILSELRLTDKEDFRKFLRTETFQVNHFIYLLTLRAYYCRKK